MAEQQIPRLVDVAAQGQGALTAERPNAKRHIEAGRYGDVLAGWRGQVSVLRARLGAEVRGASLELAEDEALRQLSESEYWATLPDEARAAVGEITLKRQVTNSNPTTAGNFTAGTIPAGSQFRKPAAPAAQPAREEALYLSREPAYLNQADTETVVDQGGASYLHEQRVTLVLDAEQTGLDANTPEFVGSSGAELTAEVVSELFADFTVVELKAAGGQAAPEEEQIRAFAKVAYTGKVAPTDNALLAGAYSHGGIWRAVLVDDESDAISKLYVADQSWASSEQLAAEVAQLLLGAGPETRGDRRRWLGWGARVALRTVKTQIVTVRATATLRSPDYADEESEIRQNIRDALTDYFDNRPDWYTWRTAAIGARVALADRRLLSASSISVLDDSGAVLSEPSATVDPSLAFLTHYGLVDQSLELTLSAPS